MKQWEGLSLKSYRCPAGVWTIGYGHTGADVTPDMEISRAAASAIFGSDIARFESGLAPVLAGVELTQGQYDALLSLSYNIGLEAFKGSTLLRKVKANPNDSTIPAEFSRWVYAQGKKLPGLVARRAGEAKVYVADN